MTKLDEIIEMGWDEEYDGWTVEDCIHMVTGDTRKGLDNLVKAILHENSLFEFSWNKRALDHMKRWSENKSFVYAGIIADVAEVIGDYLVNVCPQPKSPTAEYYGL